MINLLCSSHRYLSLACTETPAAWNMPATFPQIFMLSLRTYNTSITTDTFSTVLLAKYLMIISTAIKPKEVKTGKLTNNKLHSVKSQTSLCSWFHTVLCQLCSSLTIHHWFPPLKIFGTKILALVFITSIRNTKGNSSLIVGGPKHC